MIQLKLVFRHLAAARVPMLLVTASLGLCFGALGASIGLVDAVSLRRLAVHQPDQLVTIAPMNGEALLGLPDAVLTALIDRQTPLQGLCGYSRGAYAVRRGQDVSRRGVEALGAGCFELLGVRPALGRVLEDADNSRGAPARVVVLAHAYWRRAFGSDPRAIGQSIRLESQDVVIVGVLPPSFLGLHADQGPDLVVPLELMPALQGSSQRPLALYAVGRLRHDVSLAAAASQIRSIWPALWAENTPTAPPAVREMMMRPSTLRVEDASRGVSDLRTRYQQAAYVLTALALGLALMAGVNAAVMFSAQSLARRADFAVMAAVGSGPVRISRQLLAESFVVGLGAALLAVAVARALGGLVAGTLWVGFLPMTMEVAPGPWLLAAIAVGTLTAVSLAGIPAVLVANRRLLEPALRTTRGSPLAKGGRWILNLQGAVVFAIVFAAVLFARNMAQLSSIEPGYERAGLAFSRLERIPEADRVFDVVGYTKALLEHVEGVPGVRSAALAAGFPTTELRSLSALVPVETVDGRVQLSVLQQRASPGFFRTLDVPLVQGREFTFEDTSRESTPAVLTETAAAQLFPGRAALEGELVLGVQKRRVRVIGVVPDFSPGDVRIAGVPMVVTPLLLEPALMSTPALVIRSRVSLSAASVAAALGRGGRHYATSIRDVDAHLMTMLARERVVLFLAMLFASVALVAGGAGLFASIQFAVRRRSRELAIRQALGATRKHIIGLVGREATVVALVSVAAGLPLALAAGRASQGLLYRLSASDSVAIGVTATLIAAVAVLAAAVPLRQAVRVTPAELLRE